MNIRLDLSQKLVLSGKMLESIEILQLSQVELSEYLNDATVANPVIEAVYEKEDASVNEGLINKLKWLGESDEQNKVFFKDDYNPENLDFLLTIGTEEDEFIKALLEQLHMLKLPKKKAKICEYVIESLDSNGYIYDAPQLASSLSLDHSEMQECLRIVQSLEPAGVAATSLSECLRIQLERRGIGNDLITSLIDNDLQAIQKNRLTALAKKYKVGIADIEAAVRTIKSLNPKPGNAFMRGSAKEYIIPDVLIVKFREHFEIILNNSSLPSFQLNKRYLSMLDEPIGEDAKEYIKKNLVHANWLMKCIDKRNTTLLGISRRIVDRQQAFFAGGHLSPLKLSDIAKELDVHESTISRAVRNKYLQCSRGIFPFSYFFTRKIETSGDSDTTNGEIKAKIADIVSNENKRRPLSDQKITDALNDAGFSVKRRTVTKYRAEMGISGASERKSI